MERRRVQTETENITHCTSALFFGNSPQDIKDIFEIVYRDTDRNANFAQYLFWDLACFLQGLIEGAAILQIFFDGDIFSSYSYIVPIKSKAVYRY